jgi:hypothetical protein
MLDAGRLRRISEQSALPDLAFDTRLHELLHREYPVDTVEHAIHGRAVLEIPTHHLGPQIGQLPGRSFLRVTGQGTYGETPLQQVPGRSASLLARGPTYQDHALLVAHAFHALPPRLRPHNSFHKNGRTSTLKNEGSAVDC